VLDAEVYRDPQRYRRELDTVFGEAWFPAMPSSDVAAAGDYVVWDQLEQSVAVVRLADGSVTAWHNVCQHRGAWLVEGAGHCARGRIRCPWHGFGYDLDGTLRTVPLRDSFDESLLVGMRTPRVRATEWAGWVWLTLSPDTPELLDYLGVIGEQLAGYGLDGFTTKYRHSVRLRANWKIVVDAFNETWHVPFTHKDTLGGIIGWRDAALKIASPHSWMTLPVRGLTDKVGGDDPRRSHICHYLAFPNTIFSCFPTHLQMWSAWPVSVEETLLCAYEVVGPTPEGMTDEQWARANERDWKHFLDVLVEDSDVIDGFAKVTRSRGFHRVMFNTAESRLTAFHAEIAQRVGD
jgi:phenylpropionate dioxygenase-like ring-hydroxylating dioxygenase large terminal subunit